MRRYYNHERRLERYSSPELDQSVIGPVGYPAIRGREQDLIDAYGGIGAPGLENRINGIGFFNLAGPGYKLTSFTLFGKPDPSTLRR